MQKEVKVGIASLRGSYDDLLQELLKLKKQYQNIVVYTTLLDKKEQELAFAALELGIPYWVFVANKEFKRNVSKRGSGRFWWLYVRAKNVKRLQNGMSKATTLQKRVIKMCDIVLRI